MFTIALLENFSDIITQKYNSTDLIFLSFTGDKMPTADIFHSSIFDVCRPSGRRGDSVCFPTSSKYYHSYLIAFDS